MLKKHEKLNPVIVAEGIRSLKQANAVLNKMLEADNTEGLRIEFRTHPKTGHWLALDQYGYQYDHVRWDHVKHMVVVD